jgi:hypothetical protein
MFKLKINWGRNWWTSSGKTALEMRSEFGPIGKAV